MTKTKDIIRIAALAFGIQFVNAILLANMASLFRFFHASGNLLPLLGLAAPVAGVVIQPLIGQLSDNTHTRIGKRHPYILGWTILATLSCLLMPFVHTLLSVAILIWLISCSVNGAIESLRAYTGDVISDEQKESAFAWQTFFAGCGASLAMATPAILTHWYSTDFNTKGAPLAIKLAFLIGGLIWGGILAFTFKHTLKLAQSADIANSATFSIRSSLNNLFSNVKNMSEIFRDFSFIQLFTWMGMYIFWLFFGVALAQRLFSLSSSAALLSASLNVNIYFGIYQLISMLFALCIPLLSKVISPLKLHGTALLIGGCSILLSANVTQHYTLILCMCGVGILWGSIMTLPYAIISKGIPSEHMGITFGLFNISITVPQIIAGMLVHSTYNSLFHRHASYLIIISGLLIIFSSVLTLLYKPQQTLTGTLLMYRDKLACIHANHYLPYATNEAKLRLFTLIIILLMTLGQLAITIYLSAMPIMTKVFATNHAAIQLTITVYLIAYGLSQFFYGPLSDIYGRRMVILFGLWLFSVATFFCAFTVSIKTILIARFMQGLGMGCGDTMGRAILCDKFENDRFIRAAAVIGMAATIMPFAGPVIGSYLLTYGHWRYCFVVMLLYGLSILATTFYLLPETKPQEQLGIFNFSGIIHSYQFILRNRLFLGFFIPGLVCFIGEVIYSIISPFLIQQQLGYSAIAYGWFTLFTISGLLLGTVIAHIASHQIKYQTMVWYGLIIQVVAGLCMLVPSIFHYLSLFSVVFPMTIFMLGVGMIYPNTNMGALTPFTATAGIAGALQGGLQMLCGGIIASHLSLYSVKSSVPLSTALFLLATLGLIFFYWLIYKEVEA